MEYINCGHCNNQIQLKSEFTTFCDACGKRLGNSFQDWKKANPSKSFGDYKKLFAVVKRPDAKVPPKKKKSLAYWAVIACIYAAVSVTGGILLDLYLSGNTHKSGVSSEIMEKEWKTIDLETFLFESPFDLEAVQIQLPEQASNTLEKMENFQSTKKEGLQVLASYLVLKEEAGEVNLRGAANGSISEMRMQPGVSGFSFSERKFNMGKTNGILLQGKFKQQDQNMEFRNYIFASGRMAWQLTVLFPGGDDNARKAADKIGNSIAFDENIRV